MQRAGYEHDSGDHGPECENAENYGARNKKRDEHHEAGHKKERAELCLIEAPLGDPSRELRVLLVEVLFDLFENPLFAFRKRHCHSIV